MYWKCMKKIFKLNFSYWCHTIECKFDVDQSCRAQWGLSYCWSGFLNLLSEFPEKLTIKTFTIRNVLKCMENVL